MFSGIVERTSKQVNIKKDERQIALTFAIPKTWQLSLGESVNVDGICLTVEKLSKKTFSLFAIAETLRRTNLLDITKDHLFNLERPLTLKNLIGGHLVSGHIDTTGVVTVLKNEGKSKLATISIDPKYTRRIIEKGSIAVSGVSLTVTKVGKDFFRIALIPHTLLNTNLGQLAVGSRVNVELDMVGKYVAKLVNGSN